MTIKELEAVCTALSGLDGNALLRFLREVYHQRPAHAYEACSEATIVQSLRLGLIPSEPGERTPRSSARSRTRDRAGSCHAPME